MRETLKIDVILQIHLEENALPLCVATTDVREGKVLKSHDRIRSRSM